ncbi:MAG TPA: hypothetical protein V6C81_32160 [Planktothrix sp.]|jgi:hypothetical protein
MREIDVQHPSNSNQLQHSFVYELLHSAVYEGAQLPLQGLAQLGAKKLMMAVTFMQAPVEAPFGSAAWHAQTLGGALGYLALQTAEVAALHKFGILSESEQLGGQKAAIGFSIKESAVLGAFNGAALKPGDLRQRCQSGITNGALFAGMTATSLGLGILGANSTSSVLASLKNPIVNGVLSGVVSGAFSGEAGALSSGRLVVDGKSLGHSIYSMSLIGAVFGIKGSVEGALSASAAQPQTAGLEVRRTIVGANPFASSELQFAFASAGDHSTNFVQEPAKSLAGEVSPETAQRQFVASKAEMFELEDVRRVTEKELPPQKLSEFITRYHLGQSAIPAPPEGAIAEGGNSNNYSWMLGSVDRADGHTIVRDHANLLTRVYDQNDRLTQITSHQYRKPLTQHYLYDANSELRAVQIANNNGLFRTESGWARGSLDRATGRLKLMPAEHDYALLDPDGGVIVGNDKGAYSITVNSRFKHFNADRAALSHVDAAHETATTNRLLERLPQDEATGQLKAKVEKLRGNLSGSGVGLLFGHVNSEITNGGPHADRILAQSIEYLQNPFLTSLDVAQLPSSNYSVRAQRNSSDEEFFPDGSYSRIMEDSRVTRRPNQHRIVADDKVVREYDRDNKLIRLSPSTQTKGSERVITYDDSDLSNIKIERVHDITPASSNTLERRGDTWTLSRTAEGVERHFVLGKGTTVVTDTDATFAPLDSDKPGYRLQDIGELLSISPAGRRTRLTSDGRALVTNDNLEAEKETFAQALSANGYDDAPIRNIQSAAQKAGTSSPDLAALLSELTWQLHTAPQRTGELTDRVVDLLNSSDAARVRINCGETADQIIVGNQVLELPHDTSEIKAGSQLLQFEGGAQRSFTNEVVGAVDRVDPAILNILTQHGITVVGADLLSQVNEGLAAQNAPPNWPGGVLKKGMSTVYDPASKQVFVMARSVNPANSAKLEPNKLVAADTLFSMGGAVDHAIGGFSSSQTFVRAFYEDMAEADWMTSQKYSYYSKGASDITAAQKSLFAELFAIAHGSSHLHSEQRLTALFPRCVRAVNEKLRQLRDGIVINEPPHEEPQPVLVEGRIQEAPPVLDLLERSSGLPVGNLLSEQHRFLSLEQPAIPAPLPGTAGGDSYDWENGTVERSSDGTTVVVNRLGAAKQVFDRNGRLIHASSLASSNPGIQYVWNDDGSKLKAVFLHDKEGYVAGDGAWVNVEKLRQNRFFQANAQDTQFSISSQGDLVRSFGRAVYTVNFVDGSIGYLNRTDLPGEPFGLRISEADWAREKTIMQNLAQNNSALQDLFSRFESASGGPSLSRNAESLKAVNRMIVRGDTNLAVSMLHSAEQMFAQYQPQWMIVRDLGESATLEATGTVTHRGASVSVEDAWNSDGTFARTYKEAPEITYDESGLIKRWNHGTSVRDFTYDADGEPTEIVNQVAGRPAQVWRRFENGWTIGPVDAAGDSQKTSVEPAVLSIDDDGSVTLESGAGTKYYLDGRAEFRGSSADGRDFVRLFNGRVDYLGADLNTEKLRLEQTIKAADFDAEMRQRMIDFLSKFQEAATQRHLTTTQQSVFLWQLNRLIESPSSSYAMEDRLKLAEQLLSHATDPVELSQGGLPTCALTTLYRRLQTKVPDKAAQLVVDLVLDGSYTCADGSTISASSIVGGVAPDAAAKREMRHQESAKEVTRDGARDWAGQIAQSALLQQALNSKPLYLSGSTFIKDELLQHVKGNATYSNKQLVWIDSNQVSPINPLLSEQNQIHNLRGYVIGQARESEYMPLFNDKGEPLSRLEPGEVAYNGSGEPIVRRALVNEIGWGPAVNEGNALVVRENGEYVPLRDGKGEVISDPPTETTDTARLYHNIAGDDPSDFSFVLAHQPQGEGVVTVQSADELAQHFKMLEENNALPAIMRVDVRHYPFNQRLKFGGHAINVYDRPAGTDKIRFANQWGQNKAYMNEGVALSSLFEAMRPPKVFPSAPNYWMPLSEKRSD